jgi:hypothetical protein
MLELYPKIGHKIVLVDALKFVENDLLLLFYTSNPCYVIIAAT